MNTHKLIDGVNLAVEAVTDCKNAAEFKAWVAEKNANGACLPWNAEQAEAVYNTVMAEVSGNAEPKPAKGK